MQPPTDEKPSVKTGQGGQQSKPLIVAPNVGAGAQTNTPDKYTKKDPTFFNGGAPNQVFKFERWGVSYGTDDKGHAASIILSVLLVVLLAAVAFGGLFVERSWMADMMKLLGTAFTFTAGVAIGKSSNKSS